MTAASLRERTDRDPPQSAPATADLFAGGGEMGRRMRQFDWEQHPLGTPVRWPQSLKTIVADSLGMVLGLDGHQVVSAYTGAQALELAHSFKPEIVLLDIGLPGVDGYEVARRIRALAGLQSVHLVAITGYGQDADKARARAAGFADHLVKPVEFTALQRILTIPASTPAETRLSTLEVGDQGQC